MYGAKHTTGSPHMQTHRPVGPSASGRRVCHPWQHGEVELETAPLDLMPHTTHYFLTLVETGFWDGCHAIRNAGHVIQLNCHLRSPRHKKEPSIVFQVRMLPPPPSPPPLHREGSSLPHEPQ